MAKLKQLRFRYSLRLLLVVITLSALLFWVGVQVFPHPYDGDATPLSAAVMQFNAEAASDPIGSMEPPITEEEVLAAINSQLPGVPSPWFKQEFENIVKSKRIPLTARLYFINAYGPPERRKTVWFVSLEVEYDKSTADEKWGYALPIRTNYSPSRK